jgi:hypothetical protein
MRYGLEYHFTADPMIEKISTRGAQFIETESLQPNVSLVV